MTTQLTIFFDEPFWVAVVEIDEGEVVRSARHVFGAEPTDPEILRWVNSEYIDLLERAERIARVVGAGSSIDAIRRANPKRAKRLAQRAVATQGPSSKAEEAMRIACELNKKEGKSERGVAREIESAQRFKLKKQRAKAKGGATKPATGRDGHATDPRGTIHRIG